MPDDDRAFLESLVGQIVAAEGEVQNHAYSQGDGKGDPIPITTLVNVLVTTEKGRQLIGHIRVRNTTQLRYPPGSRVRFSAVVRSYARSDNSVSWSLSGPFDIELVEPPPALRPAREEASK
jgi:hypothetical protein